ncbi:MAG: M28 family peptidase [Pyrinomonadaceae bacterium]
MNEKLSLRRALALLPLLAAAACAVVTGQTPPAPPQSKVIDAARLLRDVQTLAADDMQGRQAGTEGGEMARAYVVEAFKKDKLKPFGADYLQPFSFVRAGKTYQGANVVGYVEGKSKLARYLVVSAHYDHIGVAAAGNRQCRAEGADTICNGADDNASGTAALFAMAEYFAKHRPEHSIIFVAFDAEEAGLQGSQQFVKAPPVALSTLAADVNMDMVSRNDRGELYAAGAFPYPFLKPYLDRVAAGAPVHLIEGHDDPKLGHDDWTFQSDQGPFHAVGVPFVYFGVEDHKDYHKATDEFANIQPAFFVHAVETILSAVELLDRNLDSFPARAPAKK